MSRIYGSEVSSAPNYVPHSSNECPFVQERPWRCWVHPLDPLCYLSRIDQDPRIKMTRNMDQITHLPARQQRLGNESGQIKPIRGHSLSLNIKFQMYEQQLIIQIQSTQQHGNKGINLCSFFACVWEWLFVTQYTCVLGIVERPRLTCGR